MEPQLKNRVPYLVIFILNLFVIAYSLYSCNEPRRTIKVKTTEVQDIRMNSARAFGYIVDIGEGITHYGHCWAGSINPTIENSKTDFGDCTKSLEFSSEILDLEANSYYHVRAYALNGDEVVYGEDKVFKTGDGNITLTTKFVSKITRKSAISGGYISHDGVL